MNNWINSIKSMDIWNLETLIDVLFGLAIIGSFWALRGTLSYLTLKLFNLKVKDKKIIKRNGFYKPLRLFFTLLGIYIAILLLHIPGNILDIVNKVFRIAIITLIATGFANNMNPSSPFFRKMQKKMNTGHGNTIVVFLAKIIKIIIYLLAGVIIISELGYDINGLIAGLGIGGLTVALAAQDAAKNIFGGFVILADKPFAVGDWIQTGTLEGVVEDITFRSTRIRTFENSIVTIPNSTISNSNITNWSQMKKRRIYFEFLVTFDSPLKNVCNATSQIQLMLQEHPDILNDSMYVHMTEIKDSGLSIMVYCFTQHIPYEEYLATKENVNYKILQILVQNKVQLAFPTRTIQTKK